MGYEANILVAEDDVDINRLVCRILGRKGYQVTSAFSGTEAKLRLEMGDYDLLVLDLMLPGMDGETLLYGIRTGERGKPAVLVLSAKSSLEDKVGLLTGGADDYMTKPFEPEELLARVYACLRRAGKTDGKKEEKHVSYKKLSLIPEARKATVNDCELELTPHEYDILYLLVQAPDKVFSRESLYEKVWNGGYYGEDNTVNVHVSNIRKKLAAKDPGEEYIKTVWGIGFKMA